jgi:hypothetical protein
MPTTRLGASWPAPAANQEPHGQTARQSGQPKHDRSYSDPHDESLEPWFLSEILCVAPLL